jgi:hypothetical protein
VSGRESLELPTLRCVECAATTTDGRGWRGYLTVDDDDDDEPVEVVVLCPTCAKREFAE